MTNLDKIRQMSAEELAQKFFGSPCSMCSYFNKETGCEISLIKRTRNHCYVGISEWLNEEVNPIPELKVGDVLDVTLEDGAWYDGICVARGIVYVMSECICKEITEVRIKAISRWSSGGMKEVWRAENE